MTSEQDQLESLRHEADLAYSEFSKKLAAISARRVAIVRSAHVANDAKKIGIIQRFISKLTS